MRLTPRQTARYLGMIAAGIGILLLIIGPFIGDSVSPDTVLTVEPISYAGAITLIAGPSTPAVSQVSVVPGGGASGMRQRRHADSPGMTGIVWPWLPTHPV